MPRLIVTGEGADRQVVIRGFGMVKSGLIQPFVQENLILIAEAIGTWGPFAASQGMPFLASWADSMAGALQAVCAGLSAQLQSQCRNAGWLGDLFEVRLLGDEAALSHIARPLSDPIDEKQHFFMLNAALRLCDSDPPSASSTQVLRTAVQECRSDSNLRGAIAASIDTLALAGGGEACAPKALITGWCAAKDPMSSQLNRNVEALAAVSGLRASSDSQGSDTDDQSGRFAFEGKTSEEPTEHQPVMKLQVFANRILGFSMVTRMRFAVASCVAEVLDQLVKSTATSAIVGRVEPTTVIVCDSDLMTCLQGVVAVEKMLGQAAHYSTFSETVARLQRLLNSCST